MLCDWLLLIGATVAEVEQEQVERSSGGSSSRSLLNGMREVRVNYREMEAE